MKDNELLFGKICVYFEAQLCSMCLYAVEPPSRRDVLWMHNHPFHTGLYTVYCLHYYCITFPRCLSVVMPLHVTWFLFNYCLNIWWWWL